MKQLNQLELFENSDVTQHLDSFTKKRFLLPYPGTESAGSAKCTLFGHSDRPQEADFGTQGNFQRKSI